MAEKKPPLKELLLQAGFDNIASQGWQDLSLRKLASSCKVSHVASYRYFKNKDDLMFALVPIISKHFADFLKESEKENQAFYSNRVETGYITPDDWWFHPTHTV